MHLLLVMTHCFEYTFQEQYSGLFQVCSYRTFAGCSIHLCYPGCVHPSWSYCPLTFPRQTSHCPHSQVGQELAPPTLMTPSAASMAHPSLQGRVMFVPITTRLRNLRVVFRKQHQLNIYTLGYLWNPSSFRVNQTIGCIL